MSVLFSPTKLGSLSLQNHLVMCPLTRSRGYPVPGADSLGRSSRQWPGATYGATLDSGPEAEEGG